MSLEMSVGARGAQKKEYVAPQVRRIGLSLAEVAVSSSCWGQGTGPEYAPDCTVNLCYDRQ